MSARSLLILATLLASAASAAPSIDPQYGDHAVIQRGKAILITGSAAPGERLKIDFAGTARTATANAAGRWSASFPVRSAGGPHRLNVAGPNGAWASSGDILIGDVWLCSGQSNMEYPLRRALNGDGEVQSANDPDLRVMKVPQQLSRSAEATFAKRPSWQRVTPDSAKDFSAACYFMARDLRASQKVPIGAIDDSWGGTPIRAWMNEAAVRDSGGGEAAAIVEQYRTDPTTAIRTFGAQWGDWWRSQTGDKPGREPWNASNALSWKPLPSLTYWDSWSPQWKAWVGSIWARQRVTLTAAEAAQPATLSMSAIDDMDQAFVNGIPVGGANAPADPRNYALPVGVLKPGANEIMVFVRNAWGPGGFAGPAEQFALRFADGRSKPLTSGWQYARIDDSVGSPPNAPWEGSSGVSTIYNAMVAPLGNLGLKGVAWYQGEADVGQPGYDRRLAAWMANWRSQFRDPALPFLIVGLAGWGKPSSTPVESGWAALINEQRIAVTRDPRTALASAIDLGDREDIHPANKQEVGRRLALAAKVIAYPGSKGILGPMPLAATRQGTAIIVNFSKPLQMLSGAYANAIELCGSAVGSCRYALAEVRGARLEIAGDGEPVVRVRHGWTDFPVINLYDRDMLPVPVFELPVN
ncbi:MAG: sialate O-acetylesterase [Pseudomonadota bacterium]